MGNLAEYFVQLPSEIAMSLFKKICAANEHNGTTFHGWSSTSKGAVRDVIVKMLTPTK
jgi:hypothetical protein